MAEWTSVKRSSLKDVAIASIAINAFFVIFYLRRGDVCLVQSIVLMVIFPLIVATLEWRLNRIVWNDEWKKFEKPSEPVDQVIEGMLKEAGIPFERLGPWQGVRSFKYRFHERFLLEDGTRVTVRGEDAPTVYVGPAGMEVERLKDLIEEALSENVTTA